jgi:hypothetical protein
MLKPIKPTGIHLVRAREKARETHAYKRGTEIKKNIKLEDNRKELISQIIELKRDLLNKHNKVSEYKTKIDMNNANHKLLKENLKIQGKLLEAFDKYYGYEGKLSEIYVDSALVYGRDLMERHKMNTEVIKLLNATKSFEDRVNTLRQIKAHVFLKYNMKF